MEVKRAHGQAMGAVTTLHRRSVLTRLMSGTMANCDAVLNPMILALLWSTSSSVSLSDSIACMQPTQPTLRVRGDRTRTGSRVAHASRDLCWEVHG